MVVRMGGMVRMLAVPLHNGRLVLVEGEEVSEQILEAVASAIWSIRREYEDRCDMELEDIGGSHPVWEEAAAAIRAISKFSD